MLLGGLRYLLPIIEAAHNLGIYVITVDYLPDNIAHKYSDEYHNVSIIDKEAILKLARELEIDGIMSFAVDPGVITAAYVAKELGLPSPGPYESIKILQNKDLFRQFLSENGFNVPLAKVYFKYEDTIKDLDSFIFPLIVKPTDSAGSKGVSRIDNTEELEKAFEYALTNSLSGKVIIEEFIEKVGCSSDSDCFSTNGILNVITFSAQRFDEHAANPYTPSAFSWPSTFTEQQKSYLSSELQRLITLLKMRTSIYNVETRIGCNGKPYIMEVSPRGGGNRLAEMVMYNTGVNLIEAAVKAAVGESVGHLKPEPSDDYWAEVILHADKDGVYESIQLGPKYKENIIQYDIWVKEGQPVFAFNGANNSIGTLVLRFKDKEDTQKALDSLSSWCKVIVN